MLRESHRYCPAGKRAADRCLAGNVAWLSLLLAATAAAQPLLDITPSGLISFPTTCLGPTSSEETLTLTNVGDAPLVYTNLSITAGTADFSLVPPPNLSPQGPGESRDVTIRFQPNAIGVRSGQLTIDTNATGGTEVVDLLGQATGGRITVSSTAINFGQRFVPDGPTPDQPITITNTGTSRLYFADPPPAITIEGAGAADFLIVGGSDSGEFFLEPGESRTFSITFDPTSPGLKTAQVVIRTDDLLDCNQVSTIDVEGEGIESPYVLEILRATTTPSRETRLEWFVRFNKHVNGLDLTDFALATTDLTGATLVALERVGVSPDPEDEEVYVVEANRGSVSGANPTIELEFIDDGTVFGDAFLLPIEDAAGNPDGSFTDGEAYAIDEVAPTATIARTGTTPTTDDILSFVYTFSEPVDPTFEGTDFIPGGTLEEFGAVTVSAPDNSAPPAQAYTVDVAMADPDLDGTVAGDLNGIARVSNGLLVLYRFDEAAGRQFADVSGVSPAVNLRLQPTDRLNGRWINGGGFHVADELRLASPAPPSKIYDVVSDPATGSQAFTVEAYVRPANLTQEGPARIVSLSESGTSRNFTLGQEEDGVEVRVRTTDTNDNGTSFDFIIGNLLTGEPVHLAFSWSAADATGRLYVDGEEVATRTDMTGDLTGWEPDMPLLLANENSASREWDGDLYEVALYSRVLSPREVRQNFYATRFVRDPAGNKATVTTSESYLLDNHPPSVRAITRNGPERNNAPTVSWTLLFDDDVTNLDTVVPFDNMALVPSGVSGASITEVVQTRADREWVITATTGMGSGTLRLDLDNPGTIQDATGKALTGPFVGESYVIDRENPQLVAIRRLDPDPTNKLEVAFELEFNEPVTGLDTAAFSPVVSGGIAGAAVSGITPAGPASVYTVTASTGQFDGTAGLEAVLPSAIRDTPSQLPASLPPVLPFPMMSIRSTRTTPRSTSACRTSASSIAVPPALSWAR